MAKLEFIDTPIRDLLLVQRKLTVDNRGFFSRFYCAEELAQIGIHESIQQINHTYTKKKGAVRGMHFQFPPYSELKYVSCLRGEIFDVAVDIRKDSPTFLQWHAEILSAENQRSFLIPEGFAHGFQTLTDECELLYLHTASYMHEAEGALNAFDPKLNIRWPFEVTEISERDRSHLLISKDFKGLQV